MQLARYFMSDQAENEARLKNLDTLTEARKAKHLLVGKLKNLGKSLGDFAETLKNPETHVFDVEKDCITVGQPGGELRRPIARVTPSELDWNDLCDTLRGYIKAKQDKRDSSTALGLPDSD
jgi:hypothetical protein